ncbi:MAG: E3 binding domain-containing protein [Planctomycetota bacterium]|nr:E3 binding domain-containing protein [Planctomycetota bacterium]
MSLRLRRKREIMLLIRMPSVAENIAEATVGRWLVREGDDITPGQGIAEIVTEKASFTLEAESGGKVTALLASEKSVVPVGAILCVLAATAEEVAAARAENERLFASHAANLAGIRTREEQTAVASAPAQVGVRATPAARRLAKEHNLDLAAVAAWSSSGERPLREEDVRAYLKARAAEEENRRP